MQEREEIVVQQLSEYAALTAVASPTHHTRHLTATPSRHRYRKKLTPQQLKLLLAKTESHKPLFLLTVCEELRLQVRARMRAGELAGGHPGSLVAVRCRRGNWRNTARLALVLTT